MYQWTGFETGIWTFELTFTALGSLKHWNAFEMISVSRADSWSADMIGDSDLGLVGCIMSSDEGRSCGRSVVVEGC